MNTFKSKDGRIIEPQEHFACFLGNNNRSKSKVLIWLLHIKGKYLSAKQLHLATGVSYGFLRGRLSFWWRIRYLNRKAILPAKGKPYWSYCIAARGKLFAEVRIPPQKHDEYVIEINLWQRELKNDKQPQ